MTLRTAISAGSARLGASAERRGNAARDAELLMLELLGISRTTLFLDADRELTREEQDRFEAAIERRLGDEPIQYITGYQEFFGLRLAVNPAVLIPRPETETLVEAVLERVPEDSATRILDVGTGSGAIAIAIAVHRPLASIMAVDLSRDALAVARKNAKDHGVAGRIAFVESDLLGGAAGTRFEVVASNPPYIPEGDRAGLDAEVREFEPGSALFAGVDGLAVYRRLIPQAHAALVPGGLLALEIGYGQREALALLLDGWNAVRFVDDLQGIARVALARKS